MKAKKKNFLPYFLWNSIKYLIFTRNQEANTKKISKRRQKKGKNFQSFSYLSTKFFFLSLPFYNFSSLITLILLLPLLRLLFNRLITMNDIFLVFPRIYVDKSEKQNEGRNDNRMKNRHGKHNRKHDNTNKKKDL